MKERFKTLTDLLDFLEKLNIGQIRIICREFGVIPRNHSRGVLVQKIIASYKGELAPELRIKKGRPVKTPAPKVAQKMELLGMDPSLTGQKHFDNVDPTLPREGILEITEDGNGFLRTRNFSPTDGKDYFVSSSLISRMSLCSGDKLQVLLHQYDNHAYPSVLYVEKVNDQPCNQIKREPFESLEPCFPNSRIVLESEKNDYALRALSLVAPIGKGQRGLIVAPPKTGKTMLLKKIAMAVTKNYPEIHLIVLLIDERPEEVTDFKESVKCEVACSTFDRNAHNHARLAELVFANARRRVEQGQDVMVLLDSVTRLSRAYNQIALQSGRSANDGLDISALQEPKRMFGMGRNVRGGGSLTVLATALIDTGSAIDDAIYEEFKGTSNMEIQLDRRLSEKRIFPAIDLNRSGTRREELLLNQDKLEGMYLTRRLLAGEDPVSATENLLEIIMTTDNNEQTIETLKILVRNAQERRKKSST